MKSEILSSITGGRGKWIYLLEVAFLLFLLVWLTASFLRPYRMLAKFDGWPGIYQIISAHVEATPVSLSSPGLHLVADGAELTFTLTNLLLWDPFSSLRLEKAFVLWPGDEETTWRDKSTFWHQFLAPSALPVETILMENAEIRQAGSSSTLPFSFHAMRNPAGALELIVSSDGPGLAFKATGRMGWDRLENRIQYEGIWNRQNGLGLFRNLERQVRTWLPAAFEPIGIQGVLHFGPDWDYRESLHLFAGRAGEMRFNGQSLGSLAFSSAFTHAHAGTNRLQVELECVWILPEPDREDIALRATLQQSGNGPYRIQLTEKDGPQLVFELDELAEGALVRIGWEEDGIRKTRSGTLRYSGDFHPYLKMSMDSWPESWPEWSKILQPEEKLSVGS